MPLMTETRFAWEVVYRLETVLGAVFILGAASNALKLLPRFSGDPAAISGEIFGGFLPGGLLLWHRSHVKKKLKKQVPEFKQLTDPYVQCRPTLHRVLRQMGRDHSPTRSGIYRRAGRTRPAHLGSRDL